MADKDKDSPAKPRSSTERPVKIPLGFEDALKGLLETEPKESEEPEKGEKGELPADSARRRQPDS